MFFTNYLIISNFFIEKKQIKSLKKWKIIKKIPFIIAGPCSAESEEQLYKTCKVVKDLDITILRAGIWKPRTRPGAFEGVGEIGLKWFREIKKELSMPVTVEVATPQHVELALKYDVDVLWIGARSTVNPFVVQNIADALKGVNIPIMVKNPINPDLQLWLGGIERICNVGIDKIAAIHRGFSTFDKKKYRNTPMWQLAIELKSEIPEIPLICDPSHIAGSRDLIYQIGQKALDLDYDGLMIETHIDPDNALSDAKQQVTPKHLEEILSTIRIKKSHVENREFNNVLEHFREEIDRIDREILEAVASRIDMVNKIGKYKRVNNVTVFQIERWLKIIQTRPEWAKQLNLNVEFVKKLIEVMHDESIRIQTNIVNGKS